MKEATHSTSARSSVIIRPKRLNPLWFWDRLHWIFPVAASITAFLCYALALNPFKPGMIGGGDTPDHLMAEHLLAQSVEAGENVLGPLGLDLGSPLLRFYQPLFYLTNLSLHLLTGLEVSFLNNLVLAIFFSLSPLAYCFFLLKLGIPRFAAGFGSMMSMISVAGFGNSFEAYHGCGIVTQSMGALFFPLFMSQFIGLLRGRNLAVRAAVLFALTFLSHVIMAVYAVFVGILYVLVTPVSILGNWKRLTVFALLGSCLTAFWLGPFLDHTAQMRPEPDSVARGTQKRWWFNGVTDEEFVALTVTGRLFDDARVKHKDQTDPLDKLTDKINISGSGNPRPPIATILVALGALVGLLTFRRGSSRFLLAGLAFSFLLFIGPDDHPWLRILPFMSHIQSFRCTYLIEFFAFGLAGIGIEGTLKFLWRLSRCAASPIRDFAATLCLLIVLGGGVWCIVGVAILGGRYVHPHDSLREQAKMDVLSSLEDRAYPFRVHLLETVDAFKYQLAADGYRPSNTHWGSVGPSLAHYTMGYLSKNLDNVGIAQLVGLRYRSGSKKMVEKVIDKNDKNGLPIWRRIPNGPDRRGLDNSDHYILDSMRENFLRPLTGFPLPVVCRDSHWYWLIKYWIEKYGGRPEAGDTPVPMRVRAGGLSESKLLEHTQALLYLDIDSVNLDRQALRDFAEQGKIIASPFPIQGIKTSNVKRGESLWAAMSKIVKKTKKNDARGVRPLGPLDEETGGGRLYAKMHDDPRKSTQRYVFDVDVLEPVVAVLPTEAVPGWTASLDGGPQEVFPTGPDMVGTLLLKGAHRLTYEWRMPVRDMIYLAVSMAALAIVLCACILPWRTRFRRKAD